MGIVSQKKKGVPSYTPCPEPAMLLWSCGWFCHEGFLKGKPSLSVYIYIWIGDIYKTIIDRKVVYVCLCLCKVWTIIICLPLFNIFSLYHSIKKDRNQTYHHFMKQEEIKRLHSNVYLYIYNLYTQYTYIHSSYIFCCAMGLLDEVPSCSLQFRGAGVGLCDGQPYFEPQPRGHHFLATVEW